MSRDAARAATQFFGGRVCLDFANTMDWSTSDAPQELIPDYAALLSWSKARRTLAAAAIAKLHMRGAHEAAGAVAVMQEAYALRSEIRKVAETLRGGERVHLEPLNRSLAAVPAQPR